MFGNAYYQLFPYKMVTHARVFSLSPIGIMRINEKIGLYVIVTFHYFKHLFSYDNMCSWEKIRQLTIPLPKSKNGTIDFEFIEECINGLEEERMHELETYLNEAGFDDCTLTKEENDALNNFNAGKIRCKMTRIDKIFDIATGRDIIIGRTKEGTIPLISHQHDNNGISKRIETIANRRLFDHETTLPLADRGVFLATTQAEDFHIGTRVKALTFKEGKQNENIRLFFVASINKLQILFMDYLTNATDSLPNLQISVPVKEDESLDYTFMEIYINAIKKQCIANLKKEVWQDDSD